MEVVLLPEMEVAGVESLREWRDKGVSDEELVRQVYMAMRMVFAMSVVSSVSEAVH